MKKRNLLINLSVIGLLWFSLAFACNNGNDRSRSPSDDTTPTRQTKQNTDNAERRSVKTQTGVGKPYGARDPYTCTDTSQPTNARAAAENFRCNAEEISAGKLHLVENAFVSEMESPRQYDHYKDMEAWGIDATQKVTPISGSYTEYVCDEVSDYMQNSGKNCLVNSYRNAKGICYKTSDGKWKCIMQDLMGSGNTIKDQVPPR